MEITVFDEHHEALLFWEEAIRSGKIKKGSTLLHVDDHSDLVIPHLTESVYSLDLTGFVQRQLDMGNFIIPAVMRGIFNEVVFLGRENKLQKRRKFYVGSLKGEGVWINNGFSLNKLTRCLYPDAKKWYFSSTDEPEAVRIKEGVLDIDLDYFCNYHYPQPLIKLKLTKAQNKRLKELSLSNDRYKISLPFFKVKNKVLRPYGDIRFKEIIHNDSKPWIECAIRYFVESLKMKPELISLTRSVKSGYTPKKHAQFIEKTLIKYLEGKHKRMIEPCEITSPFQINPFISCVGDIIYNPLNKDDKIKLKRDTRFIWERIIRGENFPQIFKAMLKEYDIEAEVLKREILKFILHLKSNYIIE